MKRFFSLIIIATMIACAFTSCDYVNDIKSSIIGEKDTKTTITAEQWENIDSVTNFTMNFVVKTTTNNNNGNLTMHRTYKITDTVHHFRTTYNNVLSEDTYHIIDNEQKYNLTQWNEELEQWDNVWHAYEYGWEPMSMIDALAFPLDIGYDELIYNEEKSAYVYTLSEDDLILINSYYFENGILVKVTAYTYEGVSLSEINDNTPREESIDVVFSDIGTTEIKIPSYTFESTN